MFFDAEKLWNVPRQKHLVSGNIAGKPASKALHAIKNAPAAAI
jgi:hypothetical protein